MRGRIFGPFLLLLTACSAAAQANPERPPQAAPLSLDRKACAEHNLQGKGGTLGDTPETQGRAPREDSLSEKLAQSGGVICPPPGLDPDIRAPAPNGGRTPVIPPPAPGESPSSRPD